MNRIYRLCWNRATSQWVPASELARRSAPGAAVRQPFGRRRLLGLSLLAASLGLSSLAWAGDTPVGGQIVAGTGHIQQGGNTTTIRQASQTLTLNWQSFDIGQNQTVNFVQPGPSAIAVNRILGNTASSIFGHLNANGQVWLINPNGILFGQNARVNVGGLVASTLDLDQDTLASNTRRFAGTGTGSVVNEGSLLSASGGYVTLIGNQVSNRGVIAAQMGTVALAGGSAATLTFKGNQLVHLQVDRSTLNNLAENRQLVMADGGQVIMTAGARDAVLASVVNNTGVVQARTVQYHNGTITLLGGMVAGTVTVGGTLDASAPTGGDGGAIETSAAQFNLAGDTHVTAAAAHGMAGTWLLDPSDLSIDTAAATTIASTLNGGTNVVEQTTATGASGVGTQSSGAGDINVNAAINWANTSASLSLLAYHAVNVNAAVSGAGGVLMRADSGNLTIASGASVHGGTGVTLAAATNFVNSAGAGAVRAGAGGRWLVYSTDPTLDTAGGLTPNFIQYNAPYQTAPAAASGNGFLYSVAPTLAVSSPLGNVSKVYDGNTIATFTGANLSASGLVNGNLIATATGRYVSADAGNALAVTTPGSIAGFVLTDASGVIPVYGYTLGGSRATANIGSITPAPLTASIVGNPTKVYDGTTTAMGPAAASARRTWATTLR